MTASDFEQRQPPSSYAALRAGSSEPTANHPGRLPRGFQDTTYLAEETERMESLKRALFDAFLAAPSKGIPTALVDLAVTYTNALRLQFTLMGYTASAPRSQRGLAQVISPKQS